MAATTWADFQPIVDDEHEIDVEPETCEADRYNAASESYDGICLAVLRADGTCPRAASHA